MRPDAAHGTGIGQSAWSQRSAFEVRRSCPGRRAGGPANCRGVTSGIRITIVHPPPGVSSTSSSPPTTSTNPRATASPGRHLRRFSESPSRWNGSEDQVDGRSRRIPGPRSMTRMSTRPATCAGLDAEPAAAGVDQCVVDQVGHRPLEEHRVGPRPAGLGGGTSTDYRLASSAQAGDGGLDHLVDVGAPVQHLHRAGLQTAHVQQVLDQAVQAIGLVVDGLEQDAGLIGSERRAGPRAGWTRRP